MAECGLANLGSCVVQKFFEFLLSILNVSLQPLLTLNKSLLAEPVHLELFSSLWALIVYVLSFFYGFLLMYAGFTFIISGYDAAKREEAKSWLRNTIIMIILVQASFFIYELVVELSAVLTSSMLHLISDQFFVLTSETISSIGLNLFLIVSYLIILLLSSVLLIVRYASVAIGVMLFPLGIFLYFIQPLRSYGILILNFLGISVFITLLDVILLVGFSKLVEIPPFSNIKIVVMIAAFLLINLCMFFFMFFSIIKAAISTGTRLMSLAALFGA